MKLDFDDFPSKPKKNTIEICKKYKKHFAK
jgi:hypothetical protein